MELDNKLVEFDTANAAQAAVATKFTFNHPSNLVGGTLGLNNKGDAESCNDLMPSSPSCRRRSIVEDKPSEFRLETPQSPLYQRRKSSIAKPGSPSTPSSPFSRSLLYVSSTTLSPLSVRKISNYHPDDTDMGVCPSPLILTEDTKPQADDVVGTKKSPFLQATHLPKQQNAYGNKPEAM